MLGLIYTCIYKLIKGVFPQLAQTAILNDVLAVLWIASTLTLILFATYFIREIRPEIVGIKRSLYLIIIFTSIVILLKPLSAIFPDDGITIRLTHNISVLINSISILYFLVTFQRFNTIGGLKIPVKLLIWGIAAELVLGMLSLGGYLYFTVTNTTIPFLSKFQAIAIIIFAFTYLSALNFLLRFIKIENYSRLLAK